MFRRLLPLLVLLVRSLFCVAWLASAISHAAEKGVLAAAVGGAPAATDSAADSSKNETGDAPADSPASSAMDNALPPDAPQVSEVIYKLKYPSSQTNELEVGYAYLAGDKFLSTQGIAIDDRFHLSEKFALGIGLSYFGTSVSKEANDLAQQGTSPFAYNPMWMFRATALYEPIYGKFLIGSAIVHFKLGIEAGIHLAQEQMVQIGDSYSVPFQSTQDPLLDRLSGSKLVLGPLLGPRFEAFLGRKLSVIASTQYLIHGSMNGDHSASLRKLWVYQLGVGYRF